MKDREKIKNDVKKVEAFRNLASLFYLLVPIVSVIVSVQFDSAFKIYVIIFLIIYAVLFGIDKFIMKKFESRLMQDHKTSNMQELVIYGRVRPEVEEILESGEMSEEQLIDFMKNQVSSVPGFSKTMFLIRFGLPVTYFSIGALSVAFLTA